MSHFLTLLDEAWTGLVGKHRKLAMVVSVSATTLVVAQLILLSYYLTSIYNYQNESMKAETSVTRIVAACGDPANRETFFTRAVLGHFNADSKILMAFEWIDFGVYISTGKSWVYAFAEGTVPGEPLTSPERLVKGRGVQSAGADCMEIVMPEGFYTRLKKDAPSNWDGETIGLKVERSAKGVVEAPKFLKLMIVGILKYGPDDKVYLPLGLIKAIDMWCGHYVDDLLKGGEIPTQKPDILSCRVFVPITINPEQMKEHFKNLRASTNEEGVIEFLTSDKALWTRVSGEKLDEAKLKELLGQTQECSVYPFASSNIELNHTGRDMEIKITGMDVSNPKLSQLQREKISMFGSCLITKDLAAKLSPEKPGSIKLCRKGDSFPAELVVEGVMEADPMNDGSHVVCSLETLSYVMMGLKPGKATFASATDSDAGQQLKTVCPGLFHEGMGKALVFSKGGIERLPHDFPKTRECHVGWLEIGTLKGLLLRVLPDDEFSKLVGKEATAQQTPVITVIPKGRSGLLPRYDQFKWWLENNNGVVVASLTSHEKWEELWLRKSDESRISVNSVPEKRVFFQVMNEGELQRAKPYLEKYGHSEPYVCGSSYSGIFDGGNEELLKQMGKHPLRSSFEVPCVLTESPLGNRVFVMPSGSVPAEFPVERMFPEKVSFKDPSMFRESYAVSAGLLVKSRGEVKFRGITSPTSADIVCYNLPLFRKVIGLLKASGYVVEEKLDKAAAIKRLLHYTVKDASASDGVMSRGNLIDAMKASVHIFYAVIPNISFPGEIVGRSNKVTVLGLEKDDPLQYGETLLAGNWPDPEKDGFGCVFPIAALYSGEPDAGKALEFAGKYTTVRFFRETGGTAEPYIAITFKVVGITTGKTLYIPMQLAEKVQLWRSGKMKYNAESGNFSTGPDIYEERGHTHCTIYAKQWDYVKPVVKMLWEMGYVPKSFLEEEEMLQNLRRSLTITKYLLVVGIAVLGFIAITTINWMKTQEHLGDIGVVRVYGATRADVLMAALIKSVLIGVFSFALASVISIGLETPLRSILKSTFPGAPIDRILSVPLHSTKMTSIFLVAAASSLLLPLVGIVVASLQGCTGTLTTLLRRKE